MCTTNFPENERYCGGNESSLIFWNIPKPLSLIFCLLSSVKTAQILQAQAFQSSSFGRKVLGGKASYKRGQNYQRFRKKKKLLSLERKIKASYQSCLLDVYTLITHFPIKDVYLIGVILKAGVAV